MANNHSLLFYLAHTSNQLYSNSENRNIQFNVINEETLHQIKSQLEQGFREREKNNQEMVLISDWSKANVQNCPLFLPFLEELIKKSRGLSPAGWKRKYRDTMKTKTPFLLINAFETTKLEGDFIQHLISLHQRVYLLQGNVSTFSLPNLSPSLETIFPKSRVLPQEVLEKLTKNNLELITLFFLERNDKSGYQILKDIAHHFHCILSQGTLYPLLYQLEKQNRIVKRNGKGREVVYSLTPETRNQLKSEQETALQAYQHLASFFELRGGGTLSKK